MWFKHYLKIRDLLPPSIFITIGLLFACFSLKRLNDNVTFETIQKILTHLGIDLLSLAKNQQNNG